MSEAKVIRLGTGKAAEEAKAAAVFEKAREMAKDPEAVALAYMLSHDPPASYTPPKRRHRPTRAELRGAFSQFSTRLYWLARARLYRMENLNDERIWRTMVPRASMLADAAAKVADLVAVWTRTRSRLNPYFARYTGPRAHP